MTRRVGRQQEALRRARLRQQERDRREFERTIRRDVGPTTDDERREAVLAQAGPRRRAALTCGWCKGPIEPKARGRIPKWCSATCRQRAWEQERAASSGRSAVEIVERQVQGAAMSTPRHDQWAPVLAELAHQLDTGAIFNRDIQPLARALSEVLTAFERRTATSSAARRT